MERLTYTGKNGKPYVKDDGYYNHCRLSLDNVAARLAAYEDTGLEPEEINRIVNAYGRGLTLRSESAERLEIVREIKTDRLRELAKADKEGMVVIVPEPSDHGISNPMEPMKIVIALKSEVMSLQMRLQSKPESVSPLDYTVIAALEAALKMQSGVELSEKTQSGRADNG